MKNVNKIPFEEKFITQLIQEELKGRRLFGTLLTVGWDGSGYQPSLTLLIMEALGFDVESDKAFDVCNEVLNKFSERIGLKSQSHEEAAIKAYNQLILIPFRPSI